VSDKGFIAYIQKKQDEYDEGKDIHPDQLMLLANNKFKTKKQDGDWNAPSPEEEDIIALRAEVDRLKIQKANKVKKPEETSTPKDKRNTNNPTGKRNATRKPKWMLIPPKQGEKHQKQVNDKQYYWCPVIEAWARHTPAQCLGKDYRKKMSQKKTKTEEVNTATVEKEAPSNKKVRFLNALLSLFQDDA
jgi:hypothetical protein